MEIQWPLVIFTLCVCLSCGIFAWQGILALVGRGVRLQPVALLATLVVAGIGGIASFTHLQHWDRAFNGFGHITSGITQEIIGIGVLIVAAIVYFVTTWKSVDDDEKSLIGYLKGDLADKIVVPKWVAAMAPIVGIAVVVVMSHSYMMTARPAWDTPMLILYYLAQMALLGGAAIWLIAALTKSEDAIAVAAKAMGISAVVMLVVALGYATYVAKAGLGSAANLGHYYDPTHPTYNFAGAGGYATSLMSGSLAGLFWGLVIVAGCLVPGGLTLLAKKRVSAVLTSSLAVAFVVAGGLAFRAALYTLGIATFYYQ